MMNFKSFFSFVFLFFCYSLICQQSKIGFDLPIDRSIVVTGNYGEIRPNHFHAGLDFSTDRVKNLPIKSVSDGYVSRIKISSGGYGKVLYVTHPNGYVSVYAHQKIYASKIDAYIKKKQYELKKNELEVFPKPTDLIVKKGEVIGYTGNSGSSTGPHLHFEVREEKSEIPINPLLIYKVTDNIKPVLTHIALYNTADSTIITRPTIIEVKSSNGKLGLPKYTQLLSENTFALAFSGYDVCDASNNKNNIYEAKILVDDELIYHHQLNYISFEQGRYVNVFSAKERGLKFQKCFTPSCFDIDIYKTVVNGGKIVLKDTLPHKVSIKVYDEKGNENVLTFFVKTKNLSGYKSTATKYNVFCNREFRLKDENFDITIPQGAITNNMYLHKKIYIKAPVGGAIELGDEDEKVIKAFKMGIRIAKPISSKESKLVMTANGDVIGGKFENGWLYADSKSFGSFNFKYDTVAPRISFIESKNKKVITSQVSIKVFDDLSGIADYHVYLNDSWQIAEYDAKTHRINCTLAGEKIKGKLKVEVIDRVGNTAILTKVL
jgi:hypothetical protein